MPVDCVQKEVVNLNEYSYREFIASVDRRIIRLQQEHRLLMEREEQQNRIREQENKKNNSEYIRCILLLRMVSIFNDNVSPRDERLMWNDYREYIRINNPELLDLFMEFYNLRENSKSYLYKLIEEIIIIFQNIFTPRR